MFRKRSVFDKVFDRVEVMLEPIGEKVIAIWNWINKIQINPDKLIIIVALFLALSEFFLYYLMPNNNEYKTHIITAVGEILFTVLILDTLYKIRDNKLQEKIKKEQEHTSLFHVYFLISPMKEKLQNTISQIIGKKKNERLESLPEKITTEFALLFKKGEYYDLIIIEYYENVKQLESTINKTILLLDPTSKRLASIARLLNDFVVINSDIDGITSSLLHIYHSGNRDIIKDMSAIDKNSEEFKVLNSLKDNINKNIEWCHSSSRELLENLGIRIPTSNSISDGS